MMDEILIEPLERSECAMRRLISLLTKLDKGYVPPLSSRIDIEKYSSKLMENADVWVAVDQTVDVGVVAFYANNIKFKRAFISTIGITSSVRGKGLGDKLMNLVEHEAVRKGMRTLELEVSVKNYLAIRLYARRGFQQVAVARQLASKSTLLLDKRLGE